MLKGSELSTLVPSFYERLDIVTTRVARTGCGLTYPRVGSGSPF